MLWYSDQTVSAILTHLLSSISKNKQKTWKQNRKSASLISFKLWYGKKWPILNSIQFIWRLEVKNCNE